jgi:hypothetical protein
VNQAAKDSLKEMIQQNYDEYLDISEATPTIVNGYLMNQVVAGYINQFGLVGATLMFNTVVQELLLQTRETLVESTGDDIKPHPLDKA